MGAGFAGTYVLTTDQTTLNGAPVLAGKPPRVGQVWRWQGEAVRLDGPQSTLVLGHAVGHDAWREKVARVVARRFDLPQAKPAVADDGALSDGFEVVDETSSGAATFTLIPIPLEGDARQLLWCPNGAPVAGRDYTVSRVAKEPDTIRPGTTSAGTGGGDVICFTQGTSIRTPRGSVPVEMLLPGDMVLTRDNGPQEVLWIGKRHITGARLYAMPEMRPVRIRAQALDQDIPDSDLLVSPQHRILYRGPTAQALFNSDEVLVAARDMVNDHSIFVDHSVQRLCYVHILFAEHQIIWANNVATESFMPANTSLETIGPFQRAQLLALYPDLATDLHSYGPAARRNLTKSDAAILLHARH